MSFGYWTRTSPSRAWQVGTVLVYLAALALDIWLVFVLPKGSWEDHAGLALGVIGIFAFATGFLYATGFLDKETGWGEALPPDFLDNLTSPNLIDFVAANERLLGVSMWFGIAFVYGRDPWSGWSIGWKFALFPFLLLYTVAVFLLALLWIVACFAYLIFVVPFAYLAYAAVSLPLLRVKVTDEKKSTDNPWGLNPRKVVDNTRVSAAGVRGRSTRDLRSVLGQDHLALLGTEVSRSHGISWTRPAICIGGLRNSVYSRDSRTRSTGRPHNNAVVLPGNPRFTDNEEAALPSVGSSRRPRWRRCVTPSYALRKASVNGGFGLAVRVGKSGQGAPRIRWGRSLTTTRGRPRSCSAGPFFRSVPMKTNCGTVVRWRPRLAILAVGRLSSRSRNPSLALNAERRHQPARRATGLT